jgi:hypothetical protein
VSGFVRNEATLVTDIAAAGSEPAFYSYGSMLRRLADAERFPALRRAIDAGALDDDDELDGEFRFGLGRILDGTQALIDAAGAGDPAEA